MVSRAVDRDRAVMHLLCGFTDSASGRHAGCLATDLATRLQADRTYEIGEHALRLAGAAETNYDLLIVGRTQLCPLAGALLGDASDRLIRQARCPVMVVPPGAPLPSAGRIVLAYDLSDASRAAAATAARLAARLDVTITVVLAVPESRRYAYPKWHVEHAAARDIQAAVTDGHGLDIEFVRRYGRPVTELVRAVAALEPALVVAATGRRRRWRRLLAPSVALGVARRAQRPVVIVAAPTPARIDVADRSQHAT